MRYYKVIQIRHWGRNQEDFDIMSIIKITDNKKQAYDIKKLLNLSRSLDEKKDGIKYFVEVILKNDVKKEFEEFYKQELLKNTIPDDLRYYFKEKGEAITLDLLRKIRNVPWDILKSWDPKDIIFNEEFNENISTYSHICSRSNTIKAIVNFGQMVQIKCQGIIFHESFRV